MISASHVAMLCMASFAAIVADGTSFANTRSRRGEAQAEFRPASTPRLAVIALAQQHISIYGATGKIMEAPVSTGARSYETPAGAYSILEKEEEHHSNLYDDASMPFMERLTWTGIAMHAGALPGYPASHGCARLSYGFARQLYQATKPGLRTVIVREDIIPADIEQPEMFSSGSKASPFATNATSSPNETEIRARLQSIKEAKLAEAESAKNYELKARSAAEKKAAEAASAARLAEAAKINLARMEAKLNIAASPPETVFSSTGRTEAARARAAFTIQAARLRLDTAEAQAQAKMSAARQAEEEKKTAAGALSEAAGAAEIARENTWPVSIFISRKTQRLYIRRGREPVFEGPVTIRDPDKPIGSFVFTALSYTETPGRMRWNVVSMYKNATNIEPYSETKHESRKRRPAQPADLTGARNALERIAVPEEAIAHLSRLPLPGASLIISDEGLSNETGKDTDFIVFMSGEPKGGSTSRMALLAQQGGQLQRRKRRTSSSSFRPGGYASGVAQRSRGFSPFGQLFGF
jgi:hypothetical protein